MMGFMNKIVAARITKYLDNGQTKAWISWSDGSSTTGEPTNFHMQALLARAKRDGVKVTRDTAGWLPGMA